MLERAKNAGIVTLDDDQMELIEFLRKYYQKFNAFPLLNYVCKHVEQPREGLNNEFVNHMKAWKIEGLPKIDGIHFDAVDGKSSIMARC